MSSFTLSQWNPPPPPPTNNKSVNVASAEISKSIATTPSHAYLKGLPSQYKNQTTFDEDMTIDFSLDPFTYINISNVTTEPSPFFIVRLKHVPIGTFFMANGPISWDGVKGQLLLEDRDSFGNYFPNYILTVEPTGTPDSPTGYTNFFVGRDEFGLVSRTLN